MKITINHIFPVSSPYGDVSPIHPNGHTGVDLAMPEGTDILCPADGYVTRIVEDGANGLGNGIYVRMEDGRELVFGHLSKIKVRHGEYVDMGDKIAESGNTGHSTGAHLHLALKNRDGTFSDPEQFEGVIQEMVNYSDRSFFQKLNPIDGLSYTINEFKEYLKPFRDLLVGCREIAHQIKINGFWNWFGEQLLYMSKELIHGIVVLDDLIFLMPAIVFMIGYFLAGKNKYTKWIVPLWMAYFASEVISSTVFNL